MSDFLSFDTFITPQIIRIVFVLGLSWTNCKRKC